MKITIDNRQVIKETWRSGFITYENIEHRFWLVEYCNINDTEGCKVTIQWFYKQVPREVRAMESKIIEQFKNENKDCQESNCGLKRTV
jgi:hypothetical protein